VNPEGSFFDTFEIEPVVDTDVTPNLPALHITGNSISNPLPLPLVIAAYRFRNGESTLDNIMVIAESTDQIEDFLEANFIPLTADGIGPVGFGAHGEVSFSIINLGRSQVASLGTLFEEDLSNANVSKSGEYGVVLQDFSNSVLYEGDYTFEIV